MFSKPLAVGILGLACVSAAAGGAYLAVRQSEAPAMAATAPADALQPPLTAPVEDTEAVIPPPAPEMSAAATLPEAIEAEPAATAPPLERRHPAEPSTRRAAPAAAVRTTSPSVGTTRVPGGATEATKTERPTTLPADGSDVESEPAAAVPEAPRADPPRTDPVPPARDFVELEVPSTSVIGLRIETPVSTETAQIEDRVEARVMRDVAVDGRTAIPAGTRMLGAVTMVERGGKVRERARLGVRFHTLVLADGSQLPVRSDTIVREGESPAGGSARKIGGAAVGGAILGALIGGKKGAIVGSTAGAAGGTAVVMSGDRNTASLPAGAIVTVRLSSPLAVEVEKQ